MKIFIFLLFLPCLCRAQFDKIKNEWPDIHSLEYAKMQKIYAVDTSVFILLNSYSMHKISKDKWLNAMKALIKKYDALGCKTLPDLEKKLWDLHKQEMADRFLKQ